MQSGRKNPPRALYCVATATLNIQEGKNKKFVAVADPSACSPAPPPAIKYQPSQINFTHDRHPAPSCPAAPPLQLSVHISIYMISVVNITRLVIHKRSWIIGGLNTY